MSKRINLILKYIKDEDIVLDVGCDQAEVGIALANKNIYSYAGDISKNVIDNAIKKVNKLKLSKYITFRVSDGLKEFNNENINTLVIAGLGTYTILKILKDSIKKYPKLIIISNNDLELLRTEVISLGYKIVLEEVTYEKGKFYNLILFERGKEEYNSKELYIGHNHQNIKELNKKKKYLLNKYKEILKNIPDDKKDKLLKEIKYLED